MYLQPEKTAEDICKLLSNKGKLDLPRLEKIYELTLLLRSQIIAVIYALKQHEYEKTVSLNRPVSQTHSVQKRVVTLTIPEPLPGRRELTSDVEQHWETMIHEAIAKEAETGIPKWEKAHVQIEIVAARGTNNRKVWDVSNRAINLVINFLKGIFSRTMISSICPVESKPGGVKLWKPKSIFVPMKTAITQKLGPKNRKLHDLPKKVMEKPPFYRSFRPLPQTDLL